MSQLDEIRVQGGEMTNRYPLHPGAEPRRATNRELARWIAEGKGEILIPHCVTQHVSYAVGQDNAECVSGQQVRKWSDTEWHEPTVDYLDIDDKDYNFNKKYKGE